MSYVGAEVIEVRAWGRVVGAVALDPRRSIYAFEYDPTWIAGGVELAPLHMANRAGVYEFPELSRGSFYGLPAMLADALPDRFGNALVTSWMAEQGIDPRTITALDRLAYASNRAMGALSFAPPAGPETSVVTSVQLADLVAAARASILGELSDEGIHDALSSLIVVGSTAGGARAKAVVAYNPATGQIRSGQLDAPPGYEQWLLKLDGVGDPVHPSRDPLSEVQPYCRVEYAYYLMARAAGLEISESILLDEGPRSHFMTKRFDRDAGNERIHTQTLCALAHLDHNLSRTHSYATYFATARALGLSPDDRHQMFRRVAFNVMAVNRDDHTKNFSFRRREHGAWELAPAYDVTHSHWAGEWTQTHQMSVNGRFVDISLDDLRALGDRHEVPDIERALHEVAAAVREWRDFAARARLDESTSERIATDIDVLAPR